ncbi:MAG: hypothetical protein AAB475_00010 [Patescibacteria group bacterium]
MIKISFSKKFLKQFEKLEYDLQKEVKEKIKLFTNTSNHKTLNIHKLKGEMKRQHSFSVNYKTRIVFEYASSKKEAILLVIGDHAVYK